MGDGIAKFAYCKNTILFEALQESEVFFFF